VVAIVFFFFFFFLNRNFTKFYIYPIIFLNISVNLCTLNVKHYYFVREMLNSQRKLFINFFFFFFFQTGMALF
jgi:hypothetical protein